MVRLHSKNGFSFKFIPCYFFLGDEKLMKDIVGSVGPISMSLCVDRRFKHYKGGVFSESDCCTKNNHAPMITGLDWIIV